MSGIAGVSSVPTRVAQNERYVGFCTFAHGSTILTKIRTQTEADRPASVVAQGVAIQESLRVVLIDARGAKREVCRFFCILP